MWQGSVFRFWRPAPVRPVCARPAEQHGSGRAHGSAVAAPLLQVQLLLSSNDVEVDDSDYHQRTALHLAASNGHIAMVRHLVLVHGANMNVIDRCALSLPHSEP